MTGSFTLHWFALFVCLYIAKIVPVLSISCYSCMPTAFKEKWSFLKETYYLPANFTDLCNGDKLGRQIETVRCFGPCVTLVESSFVGGQFTGHHYVRGCMDRIARKGFNSVTIRQMGFERYDICHKVMRSQLFRNAPYVEDQITMCTCFEDRCNSARQSALSQVPPLLWSLLLSASVRLVGDLNTSI